MARSATGTSADSPDLRAGGAAARARLVVHVAGRASAPPRRLRPRPSGSERNPARRALRLEVDDLQGRRLAVVDDAGARTELALPAGTCVVTAIDAGRRLSYTLTLEAAASFDLHVRLEQP